MIEMRIAAGSVAAWRVGVDAARAFGGIVATLRTAIAPATTRPTIAVLAGAPIARRGTPSFYRIRLHNPSELTGDVRVELAGFPIPGQPADFRLRWDERLAPHASVERWLRSSWNGDAALVDAPAQEQAFVDEPTDAGARWTITATLAGAEGAEHDALRIQGSFLP